MLRNILTVRTLVGASNKTGSTMKSNLFAQYSTKVNANDLPAVHTEEIKANGKKVFFCRCWQSKKFPYCDASHKAYNEKTGDKLGPVIVFSPANPTQPEQK